MIAAEPDKKVYLTIAKTNEERAPTRKLRKLAKYIESIEQGNEVAARLGVQAVPFERIVKVGINVAAYLAVPGENINFTIFAKDRYSAEQLEVAASVAR